MEHMNSKVVIAKSEHDGIVLSKKNEKLLARGKSPILVVVDDKYEGVKNVFPFDYEEFVLYNKDEAFTEDEGQTFSRYRVIYGDEGRIINCAKNSYHIVSTKAVSSLAEAFISQGLDAKPFIFNGGAKIGLSVTFGNRPSKVGECQYTLIVTVPNDGSGMGYLAVKQLRLICGNGQTRRSTVYKDNNIKIPHTFNYEEAIDLMKESIQTYGRLMSELENRDVKMLELSLSDTQVRFNLNKWFYDNEMPVSQKTFKDDNDNVKEYTFNMFREQLIEDAGNVPLASRYSELMDAFNLEMGYNEELKLDLSMYTVFASVTNYLSRRVEKSGSTAPQEIKDERASTKLSFFDKVLKVAE